jgi:hypothetical protein
MTDTTSTAVEVRDESALELLPPAKPVSGNAIATLKQHAEMMTMAYDFANVFCYRAMCPDRFKGKPDDGASAILYGAELGLTPIASLQRIFVVHGMPAIEARTMVALLKQRGYRVQTVETSDESVTVEGWSPDGRHYEVATWTAERAAKAGYTPTIDEKTGKYRTNTNGKLIGNEKYLTDPQAMLFAKAAAEVCRKLAPDVLLGLPYTREELETENFGAERVESRRPEPTRARGVAALAQRVAQPTATAAAEPEQAAPEPDPAASEVRRRWLNRMFALLAEGDCADRDDQLIVIAALAGLDQVPSHRDSITDEQLRTVVGILHEASKEGRLGDLITDVVQAHTVRESAGEVTGE